MQKTQINASCSKISADNTGNPWGSRCVNGD
ncbi:hypothetical protein LTSERUB_3001, partial [Salmonella enterica subsp. enterica serovar Rubislaw str. A4-653]